MNKSKQYKVIWEIDVFSEDIDIDNHENAAREALRIMRDPESIATVFTVRCINDGSEKTFDIRLDKVNLF